MSEYGESSALCWKPARATFVIPPGRSDHEGIRAAGKAYAGPVSVPCLSMGTSFSKEKVLQSSNVLQALTSYQRSTAAVNELWQSARQSSLMVKGAQLAPRPASNTVTKEGGALGTGRTFLQYTARLIPSLGAVQQCKTISYWAQITITEAPGQSGTSTLVRGRQEPAAFQVSSCKQAPVLHG